MGSSFCRIHWIRGLGFILYSYDMGSITDKDRSWSVYCGVSYNCNCIAYQGCCDDKENQRNTINDNNIQSSIAAIYVVWNEMLFWVDNEILDSSGGSHSSWTLGSYMDFCGIITSIKNAAFRYLRFWKNSLK